MRLAPKGWFGLRDGIVTTVVDVTEQQSIVLRMTPPEHLLDAVWSFHLIPQWEDRCRLLIRTRIRLRHPGEVLATELAGPAKALLTRGILLGIKLPRRRHGERSSSPRGLDGVSQARNYSRSGTGPNTNRRPVTLSGRIRT